METIKRAYVRRLRSYIQWAFFFLVAFAGWRFYLFVQHFLSGAEPVRRPPLVEGFLPIGGLMSLKLYLTTGVLDPVHPAAPVILASALIVSLLCAKAFCGWICPVGTLSEAVNALGRRIMGRSLIMPKWLDFGLRGLKYVLLAFFLYIVVIAMSPFAIRAFIDTPYWKISDVKMLFFFTNISTTAAIVIGVVTVMTFLFNLSWCRYLCPYGALTGLLGFISPTGISRDETKCIHCHACTKHCPNLIDVEAKARVRTPECSGCLTCVSRCPAKGALDVTMPGKRPIQPAVFAGIVIVAFYALIVYAMASGHWQSSVSLEEYRALIPEASRFDHP